MKRPTKNDVEAFQQKQLAEMQAINTDVDRQRSFDVLTERIRQGVPPECLDLNNFDGVGDWEHDKSEIPFTHETAKRLVNALNKYQRPCCLCTPRVAYQWQQHPHRRTVTLLDSASKYGRPRYKLFCRGFHPYDLRIPNVVPDWLEIGDGFDAIVVDPPFFENEYGLAALRKAINILTPRVQADLFVVWSKALQDGLLDAFRDFQLFPTSFKIRHCFIREECCEQFSLFSTNPTALEVQ